MPKLIARSEITSKKPLVEIPAEHAASWGPRVARHLKCSDERIPRAGGSRELITLEEAVLRIVKEYGGIRAAARATNVDKAFISRLLRGLKTAPSNETLHKLGLEAVPLYVVLPRKRAERAGETK